MDEDIYNLKQRGILIENVENIDGSNPPLSYFTIAPKITILSSGTTIFNTKIKVSEYLNLLNVLKISSEDVIKIHELTHGKEKWSIPTSNFNPSRLNINLRQGKAFIVFGSKLTADVEPLVSCYHLDFMDWLCASIDKHIFTLFKDDVYVADTNTPKFIELKVQDNMIHIFIQRSAVGDVNIVMLKNKEQMDLLDPLIPIVLRKLQLLQSL